MYKSFKTKKYYLAFNKFPKSAKRHEGIHKAYSTGYRKWVSDDGFNYAIVIGTFIILFSINRQNLTCCDVS